MSQSEVMAESGRRVGFTCRLLASRPKRTYCGGPTAEGQIEVLVQGDSTVQVSLRKSPSDGDPRRAMRRYARPFGEPAWRDRPYPPQSDPPASYHTLWVDEDSTRSVALICQDEELGPPCTVRLATASPARILAKLDTLLGIRR
ncbi:MAG: hypothetical protein GWN02_31330 [Gemmatimonadetes bacterium]|nr:hypothetical protein [Gemmatimonadota bacterium]